MNLFNFKQANKATAPVTNPNHQSKSPTNSNQNPKSQDLFLKLSNQHLNTPASTKHKFYRPQYSSNLDW